MIPTHASLPLREVDRLLKFSRVEQVIAQASQATRRAMAAWALPPPEVVNYRMFR